MPSRSPRYDFRNRYRSMSDVAMRHRGGYCGVIESSGNIKPYLVSEVGGDTRRPYFVLTPLDQGRSIEIYLDDEDLVIERPELCMFNVTDPTTDTNVAVWPKSVAYRQIKRSLVSDMYQQHIICHAESQNYIHFHGILRHDRNVVRVAMDTFLNKMYPTFLEVLRDLRSGSMLSGAFSTKFALACHPTYGIVLYYKDIIVGYLQESTPVLCPSFTYLQEQLEETCYAYE